MNIKFSYLYRDGANYKNFNEVVFLNPDGIGLEEIKSIIKKRLVDGCWFIVKDWNLPDLHFKEYPWDNSIDHEWHEFESVEETEAAPTQALPIHKFLLPALNDKSADRYRVLF